MLISGRKPRRYIEKGGLRALPHNLFTDISRNKMIYLFILPIVAWYVIFAYLPMFGIAMAFQNFSPVKGIFGSRWIGLENFQEFFSGPFAARVIGNTVRLGFLDLLLGFPAPILFALLLGEVKRDRAKRAIQTISYMPYFISAVVLCGIVVDFCRSGGVLSSVWQLFTGKSQNLLTNPDYFPAVFVLQNIWQGLGYGSIIYIAALAGVDQELYEAAVLDGAGRLAQTWHVTLPGILPTIIIMLILRVSSLLMVSTDKILLLYQPAIYRTADVIGTYVYRVGMKDNNYGLSAAVGLFNSAVATVLLVTTNAVSRRVSDTSLY